MTITLESIGGTGYGNRAWVAEITGRDPKFGLKREFLSGVRSYSNANSGRSRGVETTYSLESGKIYEISDPQSWKRTARYFVSGDGAELTKEQVLEAVNARVAA
jgi:hypothetical protein